MRRLEPIVMVFCGIALLWGFVSASLAESIGWDPLDHRWPPVLLAGIAFALILTVCIAVPASALRRSRHVENERDTRFWSIVREQNAASRA